MLPCFHCGSPLDATLPECPACGAEVEVSRLTGALGSVCRGCDAFNEPGTSTCVSCGRPLPVPAQPPVVEADLIEAEPGLDPLAGAGVEPPRPHDLPPIDFEAVLVPEAEAPPFLDPLPIDLVDTVPAPSPLDFLDDSASPAGRPAPLPLPFESPELEPDPATISLPLSALGAACQLRVERGDALEGAAFPVGADEVGVGSGGAIAFPGDPHLAPRHATFLVRGGRLLVRDEGAPGGTFLRLRGLTVPLRPGDAFAVGDRLVRFGGPLPTPSPPAPDGTRRLGSPRPAGLAVLLEERLAGGVSGRVWLRSGPSISLGRAGCSVNLGDDPFLSQAHAEVVLDGDGTARLRDLGSANGTFLRLAPGSERELRDGDQVRIGRQVLGVSVPSERGA